MRCAGCDLVIHRGEAVAYEVVGWEKDRQGGGTNHLALRRRTGVAMHADCLERRKRGLEGQTSFS